MKPHKCPVCEGSGKYSNPHGEEGVANTCHGCDGTGIVWGPSPPWPPYDMTPVKLWTYEGPPVKAWFGPGPPYCVTAW